MNQRPQSKGLKLFKLLALAGFMIDIITVGAIFVVLGHDVGGPLECTSANGLCVYTLNSVVISQFGPSNTVENVVHGQTYCVGASSSGLVLRSTNPKLLVSGSMQLTDINLTNIAVTFQLVVVSTVIASGFNAGNCGTSVFAVSACSWVFVAVNVAQFCSAAVGRGSTVASGTTIYSGIQIILTGTADAQLKTGFGTSAGYSLFMQEQV